MIRSYDVGSLPIDGDDATLNRGATIYTSILPLLKCPDHAEVQETRIFEERVLRAFLDKLRSGIDVPNYPQFRDMNLMFLEMLEGIERGERGYRRIRRISLKPRAAIPEAEVLRRNSSRIKEEAGGERIRIKICITGPYTLSTSFERRGTDLFAQLGDALSEVVSNTIFKDRDVEVSLLSVDEPIFGFLSDDHLMDFGSDGREALLNAWEKICRAATSRGVETALHLHNTAAGLYWSVDDLNIVESHVEDTLYSSERTGRMLEEGDKFLKGSICITDFDKLIIQSHLRRGAAVGGERPQEKLARVWRAIQIKEADPRGFLEDSDLMMKRLTQLVERFGAERVPYAGPECGLKSFPSYDCALECLERVSRAIEGFKGRSTA